MPVSVDSIRLSDPGTKKTFIGDGLRLPGTGGDLSVARFGARMWASVATHAGGL